MSGLEACGAGPPRARWREQGVTGHAWAGAAALAALPGRAVLALGRVAAHPPASGPRFNPRPAPLGSLRPRRLGGPDPTPPTACPSPPCPRPTGFAAFIPGDLLSLFPCFFLPRRLCRLHPRRPGEAEGERAQERPSGHAGLHRLRAGGAGLGQEPTGCAGGARGRPHQHQVGGGWVVWACQLSTGGWGWGFMVGGGLSIEDTG